MASAAHQTATTNSGKAILAIGFLRSLSKIKNKKPFAQNPDNEGNQDRETRIRAQKIKIAAYSSMARAAGTNRTWSRALLRKLRIRGRLEMEKQRKRLKRKTEKNKRPRWCDLKQEDRLRKLVPGGRGMEICDLMDETADFITCLAMQVKVMRCLVDTLSE